MENSTVQSNENSYLVKASETEQKYYLALLIFPLSFVYACTIFWSPTNYSGIFGVFVIGFILFGEVFYHKTKPTAESIAMLIMLLILSSSIIFHIENVFYDFETLILAHLYAVYWVLCRSGKLLRKKTSDLFLLDGIRGFFVYPFGNFVLVFKDLLSLKREKNKGKKISISIIGPAILAGMAGFTLLLIAGNLLSLADDNFGSILSETLPHFSIPEPDASLVAELILMFPIACYLYGLFAGCDRYNEETRIRDVANIEHLMSKLSVVSENIWLFFILVFSILYLFFFILQGSYLFDAFHMVLPDQYTYSEYARQGFGNMIEVVIINFVLLWLTRKTSKVNHTLTRQKVAATVLTVESMIFALIASLKLYMYIHTYGFSPLRLQSAWLCLIVIVACICIIYHVLTGKKSLSFWFYFSAGTLALLNIL